MDFVPTHIVDTLRPVRPGTHGPAKWRGALSHRSLNLHQSSDNLIGVIVLSFGDRLCVYYTIGLAEGWVEGLLVEDPA